MLPIHKVLGLMEGGQTHTQITVTMYTFKNGHMYIVCVCIYPHVYTILNTYDIY